MLKQYSVTLKDVILLTPRVKHFIFEANEEIPFNYLPGQFITIHFDHEEKQLKRSYSIANIPALDNKIEFAAGYAENGPGSEYLFNLKPGDKVTISGPYGRLILKDTLPKRYIFAATSTGVTPYRAMLNELEKRLSNNPELSVVIILGVQRHSDMLYAEEFQQFSNKFPNQVVFRVQFSQADEKDLLINQFKGYVQHAFIDLNLNPAEDVVYLCGNPGMVDESFLHLKECGFDLQQIIREKYISGATSAK